MDRPMDGPGIDEKEYLFNGHSASLSLVYTLFSQQTSLTIITVLQIRPVREFCYEDATK